MMEWMSGQARSSDVPPRAGYYFGWRFAIALDKTRTSAASGFPGRTGADSVDHMVGAT
jgi:hypothetical protein